MPGETGRSQTDRRSALHGGDNRGVQARAISQSPFAPEPEPSYYDISFLKPPVWRWEVASYFFFGGLSSGAYLVSRMADRFGGRAYADVARKGALIAALAALPCAPLLIMDLGDPNRFHHMLRVWKPSTPMNLGTWILSSYSPMAVLNYARHRFEETGLTSSRADLKMANAAVRLAADILGIPLAVALAGYTGVLLSCSANPLWAQNIWLGPLFSASALGTGAGSISLLMAMRGKNMHSAPARALEKIDTLAHIAEAASYVAFVIRAGEQSRPLRSGSMGTTTWIGTAALIASEVVKHVPVSTKTKRLTTVLSASLGLLAGVALRFSFVYGGHDAASDPKSARLSSRAPTGGRSHKFPNAALARQQRFASNPIEALPNPTPGAAQLNTQAKPRL